MFCHLCKYFFRGADINRKSINQITPVMMAGKEGHSETVKLLIDHGARLDILDRDDRSILFHASSMDNAEVVKVIKEIQSISNY